MHTPHTTARFPLPWTFSTFDYRRSASCSTTQNDAEFETAKVEGRGAGARTAAIDRAAPTAASVSRAARRGRARLAARARRERLPAAGRAALARASRCIPHGSSERARDLDRPLDRPGRLRLELPRPRRGARRRGLVRPALPRQGADRGPRRAAATATPSATRATGSRTSCAPAAEDDVFFAGDSAGHCLPLTAEGIRTAFYFGIALGRELREVVEGARHARPRCAATRAFSDRARAGSSAGCCARSGSCRACRRGCSRSPSRGDGDARASPHWAFDHYLNDRATRASSTSTASRCTEPAPEPRWRPDRFDV